MTLDSDTGLWHPGALDTEISGAEKGNVHRTLEIYYQYYLYYCCYIWCLYFLVCHRLCSFVIVCPFLQVVK